MHKPILEMYFKRGVKNFLISYFYDPKAQVINRIRDAVPKATIMLDSGAYSSYSLGKPIDVDDYIAFVEQNGHLVDLIISLDVIRNGEESKKNFDIMTREGITNIPVYHQGEDYKFLDYYCKESDYIGLGGNQQGDQRIFFNYLRYVFDRIPVEKKIHLFGIMNLNLLYRYVNRLESSDASSAIKVAAYNSTVSYTGLGKIIRGAKHRITPDEALRLHEYTIYKYLEMEKQINESGERRLLKA